MRAKSSLADEFREAQRNLAEAQRTFDQACSAYFADRRARARAGEALEPLEAFDSTLWGEQLQHEAVAAENGRLDRLGGLVA